ncbi:hypothetical protein LINPERHAP2_LOCUS1452 [Linum perenne]
MTADSIWVAWIRLYILKQVDIWSFRSRPYHSWFWRSILKSRKEAAPCLTTDTAGEVLWDGTVFTKYSVKLVWDTLRPRLPIVGWYKLIWKSPCIQKHCMIAWLAIKGKLITKEIISHWGLTTDISCMLCETGVDEINHIMCNFPYALDVKKLLHMSLYTDWNEEVVSCSGNWGSDQKGDVKGRLMSRATISML